MTTSTSAVERYNPSTWNAAFGYDQAQRRPAPARLLTLAGQAAITSDGVPSEAGMAAQLTQSLDNVEQLLTLAGMDFADVMSMTIYVTDMDAALAAYSRVTERLTPAQATPPATLLEVRRLAIPSLLAEVVVTAGR